MSHIPIPTFPPRPRRLAAFVMAALLAGCGGGSGSSGEPAADGSLTVVSSTPANGATGVDRGVQPELTLSAPASADNASLSCADRAVAAEIAAEGKQVRVTPARRLLPLATCTVRAGDHAAVTFTTADGTWGGEAQDLENQDLNAHDVRLGMDAQGKVIAVWMADDAGARTVRASRYQPGGGWSAPQVLGAGMVPEVAVDAAGNALAAWLTADGTTVVSSRYTAGAGWSAAQALDTGSGLVASLRLATNAAGDAVAVWLREDDGASRYSLYARRYEPGAGWGGAQALEVRDTQAYDPVVVVDPQGVATALWAQSDTTLFHALASRSGRTGGWSAAATVDTATSSVGHPRLAVSADGAVLAGWTQSSGAFIELWTSRFNGTAGWQAPVRADQAPTGVFEPHLAMDARGRAAAVWVQNEASDASVWSSSQAPGGGWTTPVKVESLPMTPMGPRVVLDDAGNALAVWLQWEGAGNTMYASRQPAGGAWGTPVRIGRSAPMFGERPELAMDASGSAVAAWEEYDGGTRYRIAFNRFD